MKIIEIVPYDENWPLFRDYLRTHAIAAGAYAEIKRALVRYHPENWDAYYDIKDPVCDVIWSAAKASTSPASSEKLIGLTASRSR